jgi:hypothetical protein
MKRLLPPILNRIARHLRQHGSARGKVGTGTPGNPRRGIALPLVLGLALCLAVWVGSLSYTMSQSRHRLKQAIKYRRAYFLARSALQHFFLKVKTMQRQAPQTMLALETADPANWDLLSRAFVEDLVMPEPSASGLGDRARYGVASFTIGSVDHLHGAMTMEILAVGSVEGYTDTIRRVQRISR